MKKILFYSLVIVSQLFAQSKFEIDRDIIQSGNYFNSEINYFPSGDDFTVYYSYKIPYSQLYFEKNGDVFNAGFSVNIEVSDSVSNTIKRAYDNKNISVKDFDLTVSSTTYLQGLISIKLNEGKYRLISIITDKFSKRESTLPPNNIVLSKKEKILFPIVFNQHTTFCDSIESYILSNNSSAIPFNKPYNYLAIPVTDSLIKSLTINAKQNNTDVISNEVNNQSLILSSSFILCDDNILIKRDNPGIKYFLFKDFSSKLNEGLLTLEVIPGNDLNQKKDFNLQVIWIGKPVSLKDPEEAIKYLKIIESEAKVSKLLSGSDYEKSLNSYWKPLDPSPNTNYNELMNEFYQRVDYANREYKFIDGNGGAYSDRGKTYIKYGTPNKIERNASNDDKVIETWFYNNPKRTFVFVDNEGTGKYLLVADK
jgi:GWxTD domain-containing protein